MKPLALAILAALCPFTACATAPLQHPTRPPAPILIRDESSPRPKDCARIHFIIAAKDRADAVEGAERQADDMTICYTLLAMRTTFDASQNVWTCELVADIAASNLGSSIREFI